MPHYPVDTGLPQRPQDLTLTVELLPGPAALVSGSTSRHRVADEEQSATIGCFPEEVFVLATASGTKLGKWTFFLPNTQLCSVWQVDGS